MNVREAFAAQAPVCDDLGSPFTARLMRLCAERLERGNAVADRVLDWPEDPSNRASALPLRVAGILHRLVLAGDAGLAAVYPPHDATDGALWSAVTQAMKDHADALLDWIDSPPQTNEVRRAAALIPALHMIAAAEDRPLALLELGASAGLNLNADRFRLTTGAVSYGPADSAVVLAPGWTGASPAPADLHFASREGVDLRPIDPDDPEQRRRLLSYIWADQPDRMARTEAAIALRRASDVVLTAGDAGGWLAERLGCRAGLGVPVVYHTIAWQYFPRATQAACEASMRGHGNLWRLAMEADGGRRGAAITLTRYPEDRSIPLGRVDFHGRWLDWTGPVALA
ncbi:hypothetical protein OCGS_0241 [Oceaniovalibus guishaninsula JLT2003]|uniref:DUF2332 domain-containing protein n=1 Tax=Oceaniovalibus guishaninsula JLT2003 TaxID=1231392 RepID=K2HSL0_9RHOB|nr:DUF2332 family protein [Oceaniovalibus guishaninsula]EKE45624.1 hypothetical protein OCGS_0241 [Oceaniovalibus guishaninsula JLT2003]